MKYEELPQLKAELQPAMIVMNEEDKNELENEYVAHQPIDKQGLLERLCLPDAALYGIPVTARKLVPKGIFLILDRNNQVIHIGRIGRKGGGE